MQVTEILEISRNRIEIYFDEEYMFWLSKKEIKKLDLSIGKEIQTERFNNIIESIIVKKAKSKALSYLKYSDKTEKELIEKLKKEGYIDYVIEKVIEKLKDYGYINNYKYAYNYILNKKNSKSIYQITQILLNKGIEKYVIKDIINEMDIDEEQVIRKLIYKKIFNIKMNNNNKQKLYYRLIKKGFNPTIVMRVIKEFQENIDVN